MTDDYFAKPPRRRKTGAQRAAVAPSLVHLRVCDSGAVSLCGLSRFPVTLECDQWLRLLDMSEQIRTFIDANQGRLKPDV